MLYKTHVVEEHVKYRRGVPISLHCRVPARWAESRARHCLEKRRDVQRELRQSAYRAQSPGIFQLRLGTLRDRANCLNSPHPRLYKINVPSPEVGMREKKKGAGVIQERAFIKWKNI